MSSQKIHKNIPLYVRINLILPHKKLIRIIIDSSTQNIKIKIIVYFFDLIILTNALKIITPLDIYEKNYRQYIHEFFNIPLSYNTL